MHGLVHEPQCSESVLVSTHAPAQFVKGAPQVHELVTHVMFAPHALGQPPQCIGSLVVSTHEPPQSVVLPLHTHAPDMQTWLVPHGVPFAAPTQPHVDALQVRPAPHACAHMPQFDASVVRSTQPPAHIAKLVLHTHAVPAPLHIAFVAHVTPGVHAHVPAPHVRPPPHVVPLATQRFVVLQHAPPLHIDPEQHGWPAAPHARHMPPEHVVPPAVHIDPAQHACPAPPQLVHDPPLHVRPLQQSAGVMHDWPNIMHA